MKKQEEEVKELTRTQWMWIAVITVSFAIGVTALDIHINGFPECRVEGGARVLGVKSCAVGSGILGGGAVCIYKTDKGEMTYPSGYGAGDVIDGTTVCG